MSAGVLRGCGVSILVSNRLVVVSQHVQAAHIKDLIQLRGSRLVLGARERRGRDGGSSGLIGEVRLVRTQGGRGRERTSSWQARNAAQLRALAENSGHCEWVNVGGKYQLLE